MVVAVSLSVEDDLLPFRVDLCDFTQEKLHIVLIANEFSKRVRNIATGNPSCGDLIQQRLEQVEVAFIDQSDSHICGCECLAGMDPGKPTTDDDDVRGVPEFF